KNVKLTQGSFDLLEYLVREKILIGILTNGTYFQQTSKLITLGIDHMIDYLVTPDMCLADKPDPKSFRYILNKLGVKPEESLMIGDNFTADIVGAKQVGMHAVYIDLGRNDRTNDAEPDFIVSSLENLATKIR
ncbi:MAG: HAD family hydrolase, partial [Candidatus Roizmanbacteria bacterium]|nr:HAD family hydrolase [Candidatus Roizmanbacteria bacterium]